MHLHFLYVGVVGSFRSALGESKDEPIYSNYDAHLAGDDSDAYKRALAAAHIVNPAISALNRQISLLGYIAVPPTNKITD